ncbi:LysR family transcriptional regulator [Caulobacter segnis]|uniref:LysR family transcriptional regulator n=1 Tax=Caulobacter segnis TaxID=88688 RepID=A0A2W5WH72_9CAUL|nr:LysR family transcriptional regulator [Caulobacter segnis]PZR33028.1 MAG: LysR family transcriptional regulator [Caulobacter segnis]
MTLEQLRIFVAVAERQHVTQAARELNLTQSAVSSAVAALENRHGVALFDRVGRNIVLNPAGQVFLAEAKAVLSRAEAAEAALTNLGDLSRGRLSIQASQTIASYWLPARLAAFRRAWPGIVLDVTIGNTRQVAEAVAEGLAELGFVEGPVENPALDVSVVDQDQPVILVAPDHPWARSPPRAADLLDTAWVLREPGSGTRAAFDLLLERADIDPAAVSIAITLPDNEPVRGAIESGMGAGVLSRSVAAASLAAGTLVEVPFDLPPRAYWLVRHKDRWRGKAGEAFLAELRIVR